MRATLVIARGAVVYLISPGAPPRRFDLPRAGPPYRDPLPSAALEALRSADPTLPVVVCGRPLVEVLAGRLPRPVQEADTREWHVALGALPPAPARAEREEILARARSDLDAALRSPEEVVISLAREQARLERAVGREDRAAEAFVAPAGTPLAEYARRWGTARGALAEHRAALDRLLDTEAQRVLPNLSSVVGPRTAARLAAAAGGLPPLARMSASRLQLLGSRRRPSPERGPRYGAIYLADTLDSVPEHRRGAYARSLAALAVIAVRADVLTHRDVSAGLVRRREARREQLRRRAR